MTKLQDLLTRLESGEGPDRDLCVTIENAFGLGKFEREHGHYLEGGADYKRVDVRPLLTSVDAALAFKDAVLPGYILLFSALPKGYDCRAEVYYISRVAYSSDHKDLCRAILIACIKALIAQGEEK